MESRALDDQKLWDRELGQTGHPKLRVSQVLLWLSSGALQ